MTLSVAIVGAGRVASHLAIALQDIVAIEYIYSRTTASAQVLAEKINASTTSMLSAVTDCEVIFICVTDDQIATIAAELASCQYQGLVVHTSGSTPLSALSQYFLRAAVFYPLQTFSFGQPVDWGSTPLLLEANHSDDLHLLQQWANQLSDKVYCYHSEQRAALHLAAVFACNFSNYCIDIAQQLMQAEAIDTQLLQPLIQATIQKLDNQPAYQNQTGPAVRQDLQTMSRHIEQLKLHPHWQQLYRDLSQDIMQRHARGD